MMLKVSEKEIRSNCKRIISIDCPETEESTLFRIVRPSYYTEDEYSRTMEVYPAFFCFAFARNCRRGGAICDYLIDDFKKILEELERIDAILDAIENREEKIAEAYKLYVSFIFFCTDVIYAYEDEKEKKK